MLILGIETSCDETGLALYDSEQGLIYHILHSQTDIHKDYGGVVPELASRDHIRKISPLAKFEKRTMAWADLKLGVHLNMRAFRTFIASVLGYIIQLAKR